MPALAVAGSSPGNAALLEDMGRVRHYRGCHAWHLRRLLCGGQLGLLSVDLPPEATEAVQRLCATPASPSVVQEHKKWKALLYQTTA